jgi:Mg2+ and Co2+ transporter CorA
LEVKYNPRRAILFDINKTSEEVDIISDVFRQQERVLLAYRKVLDPATFSKGKSGIERTNKYPYEERAIDDILKAVRERLGDFDELKYRTTQLRNQNVQLIETEQDSNNKAILVFTIVTIFFLPLTFVSGFFGMNLSGISGTTNKASHFWEIAVPLTGAIAIPCLLLAFWSRLLRLRYSLKKPKED